MNIWIIIAFSIYAIGVINLLLALITCYYNIKGLENYKFTGLLISILLIIIWPVSVTYNKISELVCAIQSFRKIQNGGKIK